MTKGPIKHQIRIFAVILLEIGGITTVISGLTLDLIKGNLSTPRPGNSQILVAAVGILLTIFSHVLTPHQPIRSAIRSVKAPSFITFSVSCLLIILNLIGLVIPLRNPAVNLGISYAGKIRKPIYSAEEFYDQMNRIEAIDEQYPEYVMRLTQLIFDSTVHFWGEGDLANKFNLRIPIHENFIIYFMNLRQGGDELYEFCQAERAIERCASVCSQSSRVLANVLIRNRVRAQIVGLNGHVVVQAKVEKKPDVWWVLDPDYGVVIKHDITEIGLNPEIITSAYKEQGYSDPIIDNLILIYGPSGNEIIDEKLRCDKEEHLYLLKWLLPLTGSLPFLSYLFIRVIKVKYQTRRPLNIKSG